MLRFTEWVQLQERKKAHYSKDAHDAENYPQVGQEYETLRNLSKPTLKRIAANRGVDNTEGTSKMVSDILKREYGTDKVGGFYDKTKDTSYKVKARKKAKESGKQSYRKDNNNDEDI